jgi:hypothetical protein
MNKVLDIEDINIDIDVEDAKEEDAATNKKVINIEGTANRYQIKKLVTSKVEKKRVISNKWNIVEEDLEHSNQLNIIKNINMNITCAHDQLMKTQIERKLSAYKQQDVDKNRYDLNKFITFTDVVKLLAECKLLCDYCSNETFVLYEIVRELRQWSLDRVDNDKGHNLGNVIISCLECNLKRRRTNKDAFMFTKKLSILRNGFKGDR